MQPSALRGILLAILAAILWGVSGTLGQFLFQQRGINVEWLITVRLLISGILLLTFSKVREHSELTAVWRNKTDAVQLLVFSIAGMLAVQYTYFAAIKHSNAATATVLQYTGPVLIVLYLALKNRAVPRLIEIVATLLAVLGTVLLVTRGNMNSLNISTPALLFGIASAVTLAVYSIQPAALLAKYSASMVIGWGMLVGGIAFSFVHAPWNVSGTWDMQTYLCVFGIITLGTLIAFYSYMNAVKIIGAQKASLLASAEPLSATILAMIWLKLSFSGPEWIGSICVISTIFLLSIKTPSSKTVQPVE
ncbi:EamA family transporter [Dyadobacter luteus]|uniref:EamA family transporter n=1 Tax=Dyadobacter luteus TaxID=2259619 RepID=A0A3D8Y5E4_9BACT|nr:EamA family transporter [Dyadobacter luteus]REA57156.1 EamA family transporter [Dyadobacter luteus]